MQMMLSLATDRSIPFHSTPLNYTPSHPVRICFLVVVDTQRNKTEFTGEVKKKKKKKGDALIRKCPT